MTVPTAHGRPFDALADRIDARQRFVVRAVIFIYILSLIEGPLRKWFMPELASPLTLLRDPFVIMLYAYCSATGMIWVRGIARLWLGFAAVTATFGLVQYAAAGFGLHHWMLGVRTYWLYMPLAFVVARTFRRADIQSFLYLNMIIAIPYAILVAQQYNAPPLAFINRGIGGDEDAAVGLSLNIVRPFGLFTYTGTNVLFTSAMVAMFLAFYLAGVKMRQRRLMLLSSGMAVGVMSVLTGSRGIYFTIAIILSLTILGLLLTRPTRRTIGRLMGVAAFVVLAAVLFVVVFPDMQEAMAIRFEAAAQVEGSISNRVADSLFGWTEAFINAPMLGAGIGAGAPGVSQILGLPPLIHGESDLQRNLNDLGVILGVAMVVLRFATAGWIVSTGIQQARRGEAMALPLAGFAVQPIAMGQITHSPLIAFMVWLMMGFLMALKKRDHDEIR